MDRTNTAKKPRGGRRPGAGRPRASGRYGEPTLPVRIPISLILPVRRLLELGPRKLALIDMHQWNAPVSGA
ncbi:hypothetical protein RPMA_18915 [Tardiphaga alba]|uniref:Uncharacterized protein n=1 Tax=Tardiphaga alba TaxID=340268 RepID=A0ABX8ABK1_9BRAD|nr:hypothetical protein RPMA_18915 [Tardiphaga alba]